MEKMRRNLKCILAMTSVILLALVFRLAYIQIYGSDDLSAATRAPVSYTHLTLPTICSV